MNSKAVCVLHGEPAPVLMGRTITTVAPTWMMPSTRTRKLKRPAPGIPTTMSPSPASKACSAEMPITPRARLRMVAPARSTNPAPRRLTIWSLSDLKEFTSDGPGAKRKPDIATAARNCSALTPALPAIPSRGSGRAASIAGSVR